MKITNEQLRQIIKEELEAVLKEDHPGYERQDDDETEKQKQDRWLGSSERKREIELEKERRSGKRHRRGPNPEKAAWDAAEERERRGKENAAKYQASQAKRQGRKDAKAAASEAALRKVSDNVRRAMGLGDKGMSQEDEDRLLQAIAEKGWEIEDLADMSDKWLRNFAKKAGVKAKFGMSGMKQWAGFEE